MHGGGSLGGGHWDRDGGMQLVAYWAAEIQERSDWTVGSGTTDYPTRRRLGLKYGVLGTLCEFNVM